MSLAVSGCSSVEPLWAPTFEASGRLEDSRIIEASGLARSLRQSELLWVINDNGAKEIIHAIDHRGARVGEIELRESQNNDWEDLASFRLNGKSILMVADIGDNEARKKHRTLYFVAEPIAEVRADGLSSEKVDWRIHYRYPDGPRDSEAAAVDTAKRRALILSKRDIPARLYEVPLRAEADSTVTAVLLGQITSLPQPSPGDIELAPKRKDWHWQPVGMDISEDTLAAVILTYRAVYYYERQPNQDWLDALSNTPVRISLGDFKNAEAVAFGDNRRMVFVTGENRNSRLLRIDLTGASTQ